MKVFFHYEDNDDTELHKSLKITLPKSWKTGPSSRLLTQFVESYNANEKLGTANPLTESDLHLALKTADATGAAHYNMIASDAIVVDEIEDRADVYIRHGPSQSKADVATKAQKEKAAREEELKSTVACTRFGCKKRFPKGGPYPDCQYHKSPPVFHETAKFWSCCPQKKAYDWDDFQSIPGCQSGKCTDVKEVNTKEFLGGVDLREQANGSTKLKSIDDFNKAQEAGGADAAPVLERLAAVLGEVGIERELFDQVTAGIRKEKIESGIASEAQLLEEIKDELGAKLKSAMKSIAAQQLRLS